MSSTSRRRFLTASAQLGAASTLFGPGAVLARGTRTGLVPGIQLWAVNSLVQSDLSHALSTLKEIGYREVESYSFPGFSGVDFRRAVEAAGLRCPSCHLELKAESLQGPIDAAHAVGARYVVSSVLRPGTGALPYEGSSRPGYAAPMRAMTLDDARETARLANQIGKAMKVAGLQYCYHNHYFEFVDQGGTCGYDTLWQETDPELVHFEIDCGWMMVAGHDPVEYLKRAPQRVPMLHIKDFLPPAAGQTEGKLGSLRAGSELGRGALDYSGIFAALPKAQVQHVFAEQEGPFERMDQLAAARADYEFLHGALKA